MFGNIFSFELKQWLKNWQFYLYAAIFFGLGFFIMAASLGYFDSVTVTTTSQTHSNSAYVLSLFMDRLNNLLYFLFPTIIGAGIYRDYKSNAHHILYSYPFSKSSYLLGKFLSAFFVTFLITLVIGIGMWFATLIPLANKELLGPNLFWNYAQVYLLVLIPNMLFIGVIVFAVTTLSRSVYIGFIAVVVLIIIQGMVNGLSSNLDNKILGALIDPSGSEAISYYTRYWTVADINTLNLPLEKWYLLNRAIWLGVSALFFALLGFFFKFSQEPVSWRRRRRSRREVKNNFGGLAHFSLPKSHLDFSLKSHYGNVLNFTKLDFRFLARNKSFLILIGFGILLMIVVAESAMQMDGSPIYPVTRMMLIIPGSTFNLVILIITFLGAGLLVHRGERSNMHLLIDSTAVPNWVLFTSKFLALILLQVVLLLTIMVGGIIIQTYSDFHQYEIGLYLKDLLGFQWVGFIIWAGLALAVQTIFKNYIVGFFVLLVFALFKDMISKLGIEQQIFYFNSLPTPSYSDLNGYGHGIRKYFIYAGYWLLGIGGLSGLTLLFWRRGVFNSLKERFFFAKRRAQKTLIVPLVLFLVAFLGLGSYLYYDNTISHTYRSSKDKEKMRVEYEKQYKQYAHMNLPRIVKVNADVDLYPKTRDFKIKGHFVLVNKSPAPIDTLLVNYRPNYKHTIEIEGADFLSKDTVAGFMFYKMKTPLQVGDSLHMTFTMANKPNEILHSHSPVLHNGTFINNSIFPGFGYSDAPEISDNKVRKKYGLPPKERMAKQTDSVARQNTYITNDADWIDFETTVSTDKDQIAIAPGYLQKEWTEGNRRYFHYKMDKKILDFFAYNSGRYEVKRDKWKNVNIEVYYKKGHEYNLDRMIKGVKKGLTYYTENYSPYQFDQIRIIEFPITQGTFAQSFANTIPFSEGMGFIVKVDEDDPNAVDFPFAVTAHEVAHQWWAHQVIGADVRGATMLSESLAEYSSLKVLEHEYGKGQMRKFLKEALDGYLSGRGSESKKELPLMYNENQQYIHYKKGSLVFYALSDYMGEQKMNHTLSRYIDSVAFQEPPFTISADLVNDLKMDAPDSLQYFIHDMFETITLYDNYVKEATAKKLENGKYEVSFKAIVSKYRSDEKGNRSYTDEKGDSLMVISKAEKPIKSLPLDDYVKVGIFAKKEQKGKKDSGEKILYLKLRKFTKIDNEFRIVVDEKPTEVGIDPYNELIDTRSYDNRTKVNIKP